MQGSSCDTDLVHRSRNQGGLQLGDILVCRSLRVSIQPYALWKLESKRELKSKSKLECDWIPEPETKLQREEMYQ